MTTAFVPLDDLIVSALTKKQQAEHRQNEERSRQEAERSVAQHLEQAEAFLKLPPVICAAITRYGGRMVELRQPRTATQVALKLIYRSIELHLYASFTTNREVFTWRVLRREQAVSDEMFDAGWLDIPERIIEVRSYHVETFTSRPADDIGQEILIAIATLTTP